MLYTPFRSLRALGVLAVILVFIGITSPRAEAAMISDAQIETQKRAVMVELVDALTEQVKLLQMFYIRRLEAEVAQLQARVTAS